MITKLEDLKKFSSYKADLIKSLKLVREKPMTFHYAETFQFDSKKCPMVVIGDNSTLLNALKQDKIKLIKGKCQRDASEKLQVSRVNPSKIARAFTMAGISEQIADKELVDDEPETEEKRVIEGTEGMNPVMARKLASEQEAFEKREAELSPQMARRMEFENKKFELAKIARQLQELKPVLETVIPGAPNKLEIQAQIRATMDAIKLTDLEKAKTAFSKLQDAIAVAQQPVTQQPPVQPPPPQQQAPLRPPPPTTAPLKPVPAVRPPSSFKQTYSKDGLDKLKKEINRGGAKGTGDFGKLIDEAKKLISAKEGPPEKQIPTLKAFIDKAQKYLEKRGGASDGSDRDFKDGIEKKKITECTAIVKEAKNLMQDLIDAQDKNFQAKIKSGKLKPGEEEKYLQGKAVLMMSTFGAKKPDGGTSDVALVKNTEGKVAFAFKSVDGESTQTGMKKGSGAIREALTSKVADSIREQTGLDFGFPKVTVATIGEKKGALVEGIQGEIVDPEVLMNMTDPEASNRRAKEKGIKNFEADAELQQEYDAYKRRINEVVDKVPAKELQKILLCNLATAQFDIKWGNMMVAEDSSGHVSARPFDAGASFPTDDLVKDTIQKKIEPGANLLVNPVTGQTLASATEPMDENLVRQFLNIDTKKLQKSMDAERVRLAKTQKLDKKLLDDNASSRSTKSILIVQDILRANPQITLSDFTAEFAKRIGELA